MGTLVLVVVSSAGVPDGADRAAREQAIRAELRGSLSPRHVPDRIVWAPSVPRSMTGKRLEIPLKRLVQGAAIEQVIDPAVLLRPDDLAATVELVRGALG
jgi:acetoacetyl-CoA synthetase